MPSVKETAAQKKTIIGASGLLTTVSIAAIMAIYAPNAAIAGCIVKRSLVVNVGDESLVASFIIVIVVATMFPHSL